MSSSPLRVVTASGRRHRGAEDTQLTANEQYDTISRAARTEVARQRNANPRLLHEAQARLEEEKAEAARQAAEEAEKEAERRRILEDPNQLQAAHVIDMHERDRQAQQSADSDRVALAKYEREKFLSLGTCCACVVPVLERLGTVPCIGEPSLKLNEWILRDFNRSEAQRELLDGVLLPSRERDVNVAALHEAASSRYGSDAIMAVHLSHSEELMPDPNLAHPMVKVSFVDLRTGHYWKKLDARRPAVSALESQPGNAGGPLEYIMPIMSQPYKLKRKKTFTPKWHEDLLINEDLSHFLSPFTLIFFEIHDFGPRVDLRHYPDGHYPVAWAFLKLIGTNGKANLGNLRLQLFRYSDPRPALGKAGVAPIYLEWLWQRHLGRVKYPATLFVSVAGRPSMKRERVQGARPLLATQIEEGRLPLHQLYQESQSQPIDPSAIDPSIAAAYKRSEPSTALNQRFQSARAARLRLPASPCLVPNSPLHSLNVAAQGCFCLRLSGDGRVLAAACGEKFSFTIKLFDVDSGRQLFIYNGHYDLIYDMDFNREGDFLVSASSDFTAKLWYVDPAGPGSPVYACLSPEPFVTLPHPGYVYCAQFHPRVRSRKIVLTGAFDGIIRVWDADARAVLHEIHEHTAIINAITFTNYGSRFISADANGIIKIFEDKFFANGRAQAAKAGDGADGAAEEANDNATADGADGSVGSAGAVDGDGWPDRIVCVHSVSHEKLLGNVINCIRYHPQPERLVVFTRDNCIYVLGLARYDIRKTLTGQQTRNHRIRGSISPDGCYAMTGSEDGRLYVHSLTGSGGLVATVETGYNQPLYDCVWHPSQHLIAMCSFGEDAPILVMEYKADQDKRIMAMQVIAGHGVNADADQETNNKKANTMAFTSTGIPM